MPAQRPKTTTIAHGHPISRPAVSQHLKVLADDTRRDSFESLLTCEPADVLPMVQWYFMF